MYLLIIFLTFCGACFADPANLQIDENIAGNCTDLALSGKCGDRHYDECHLLGTKSYCYCKATNLYSLPTGNRMCRQHNPLYQFFLNFLEFFYSINNLTFIIVILILLISFSIYRDTRTRTGRHILPFRKSK